MSLENKVFDRAFAYTIQFEGEAYVNDPVDPGGETKFGISKRAFPDRDIKNLTKEEAKKIYYEYYWIPSCADKILDDEFAIKYFDICINMGTKRAIVIVQKLINLLSPVDIAEDGVMGQRTIHALNDLLSGKYKLVAVLVLAGLQFRRYLDLILARPAMKKYAAGWAVRAMRIPRITDRQTS